MTLIKSISGIRGTIGGKPGENFTPVDIVECTGAYGQMLLSDSSTPKVVVGRDGRMTGEIVNSLVISTLLSMGINVIDLGLSTTPTVEIAVVKLKADAGIILTASHNPKEWNALKFLNNKGEFISENQGKEILQLIDNNSFEFCVVDKIGSYEQNNDMIDEHIKMILDLPYVLKKEIKDKQYKVVVDAINSTGAISVVPLLKKLNCEVVVLNGSITGDFAHNPEPLPANLIGLSQAIVSNNADFGISVDPDVDRLAFVCEDGTMFGEEYTLVAAADYILSRKKGNTVSNLSSTRALKDITLGYGNSYFPSKVGEVNVVEKMKEVGAVIGGEGNGGVILPDLHYGRDALVGIAIVLSLLSESGVTMTELKSKYPDYVISKNKIQLKANTDIDNILNKIIEKYKSAEINTEDGLKIDFVDGWVQLKNLIPNQYSGFMPSSDEKKAQELAAMIIDDVEKLI
ncbi:MAG: phosphoglucosamine mutase [Saprospiraceae bacterium]